VSERILVFGDPDPRAVDSEPAAYWLGFILADGTVRLVPHRSLRVVLQPLDADHVAQLERDLGGSRSPVPMGAGVGLTWYPRRLVDALYDLGVRPAKSLKADLRPPVVRADLRRHFWRGVFDGDGMLTAQRKPGATRPEYRLSLCGSRPVVVGFLDWAVESAGVRRQHVGRARNQCGDSRAWKFEMSGNRQIEALASHLYEGATRSLARKRAIYEALVAENRSGYRIDRYIRRAA
jgi:hypothetical protein